MGFGGGKWTGCDAPPEQIGRRRLLCGVAAGLAALLVVGRPSAEDWRVLMDPEMKFDMLRDARGAHYRTLLSSSGAFAGVDPVATARRDSDSWEDRVMAAIFLGRRRDAELYATVEQDLDAVNPGLQALTVTGMGGVAGRFKGRARDTYGVQIVPLALEGVTKFVGTDPVWRTQAYLGMLEGAPHEISVEPVAELLFRTGSKDLQSAAALTLAKLPADAVQRALPELRSRAEGIMAALDLTATEMQ